MKHYRASASRRLLPIAVAAATTAWAVALHALVQLNVWALLGGVGFLMIVGVGISLAARI